jgi:23S rRNA (pseudouridine1915-N3)-methyltransferase
MRLRFLTITHKLPSFIKEGCDEYIKRMPSSFTVEIVEIPAEKRSLHADINRIMEKEGKKMLSHIKSNHYVIALDVKGAQWSTEQLANNLKKWMQAGKTVDLLIGGPEGLSPLCLGRAEARWSLSLLTFPHTLVRLILSEQMYRAMSILQNHPYHK